MKEKAKEKATAKYRIVKSYDGFFCYWGYRLEKQVFWWFFGKQTGWRKVAGCSLTKHIPEDWKALNIVEEITEEI